MTASREARIQVRLNAVEYGARNINLYRFVRVDGETLPAAAPGAHIDLEINDGIRRSYSLLNSGSSLTEYIIGVLSMADGRGGSKGWHHGSVVGATYWVSGPRNNFPLSGDNNETYLFAGGVGITPIISMYRDLRIRAVPVKLFYWVRTLDDALFVDELKVDRNVRMIVSGDDPQPGDLISHILTGVPLKAELYCCGPTRMLLDYERATASRPPQLVHSERFSGANAEANADIFSVKLARLGISVDVKPGETILQACLNAGVEVPYSCEEGICGACEVAIIEGAVSHGDSFRSPDEHERLRTMMICSSFPTSSELVLDI